MSWKAAPKRRSSCDSLPQLSMRPKEHEWAERALVRYFSIIAELTSLEN